MPGDAQRAWTMAIAPPAIAPPAIVPSAIVPSVIVPSARARIRLASDPLSVRDGLHRLTTIPPLRDLSADGRGTAEIVLAEALNNIVEHAYAQSTGMIDVTVDYEHPYLNCEVVDCGLPMPDGNLPLGELAPLDPQNDLPEGGFGWFLIRSLTRALVYRRADGRNTLMFRMETE